MDNSNIDNQNMNNEIFAVDIPDCMPCTQKKDKQKQYFKKWYDKRIKTEKKRVICECGADVCYMNLCNHKKTKKHIRLLSLKNNDES